MKIPKILSTHLISFTLILFLFPLISPPIASPQPSTSPPPLTVETYCQLSIDLMKVTIDDWKIKTSMLKEYGKDSAALKRVMSGHDSSYKKKRDNVYKAYHIAFSEYSRFNSRNQKEIHKYLQKNIMVKTKMDNLSQAIDEQTKAYNVIEASLKQSKPEPETQAQNPESEPETQNP